MHRMYVTLGYLNHATVDLPEFKRANGGAAEKRREEKVVPLAQNQNIEIALIDATQ